MIEKVEILKDAAATALYGIQGGNGFAHQHGLSAQGGNDKGGFFAAVNHLENDGIMAGSSDTHRRIAAQLNGQYKVTDWMQFGLWLHTQHRSCDLAVCLWS